VVPQVSSDGSVENLFAPLSGPRLFAGLQVSCEPGEGVWGAHGKEWPSLSRSVRAGGPAARAPGARASVHRMEARGNDFLHRAREHRENRAPVHRTGAPTRTRRRERACGGARLRWRRARLRWRSARRADEQSRGLFVPPCTPPLEACTPQLPVLGQDTVQWTVSPPPSPGLSTPRRASGA
jgi:hypothetical protein